MTNLPDPLTPADCDLRGYRWMPLDVVRVIDSDTYGISTGDEFKTAFRLWAKSWLQVPAASLPDDDRLLAHLAGLSENMPKWKKVKAVALRGFIKCSDGRLYHPVIAEKAIEAMSKREEHAEHQENIQSRQQRLRERRKAMFEQLRAHDIVPSWDTKTAELERLVASLPAVTPVTENVTPVTPSVPESVTGDVTSDAPATAKRRTGEGQEKDSKPKNLEEPVVDIPPAPEETPAPPVSEIVPNSRGAAISLLMRRNGVEGCNAANPIVQEWAADPKVTDDVLLTAAAMAKKREVLRPGPNYLAPIVKELLNPKPVKPRDDWSFSNEGIDRKAKELGVRAIGNESYASLKSRLFEEIRKRQGAAA